VKSLKRTCFIQNSHTVVEQAKPPGYQRASFDRGLVKIVPGKCLPSREDWRVIKSKIMEQKEFCGGGRRIRKKYSEKEIRDNVSFYIRSVYKAIGYYLGLRLS
jgi:hypothetical protein